MDTLLPAAAVAPPAKDDSTIWRADDARWPQFEPVLRSDKRRKKPGCPRHDDRAIFDGPIWLVRTGAQWTALPREFGPKSTVHARFTEWVASGAAERARPVLLAEYEGGIGRDRARRAAGGRTVEAQLGQKGIAARRPPRGAIQPTAASPASSATR